MKKTKLIIASALLSSVVLSSCSLLSIFDKKSSEPTSDSSSESSEQPARDYFIAKFLYNNPAKEGTYKNLVIQANQTISKPKDPVIPNFVFAGWYLEASCENEYLRWGLQIDSDITLYAKWTEYSAGNIVEQITNFHNVLEEYSRNVYKTVQECNAIVGYPSITESQFYVSDKYVYNRYSDITVKDYYQIGENGSEDYYGQEQFSYDSRYFYSIYHEFEDSKNDSSETNPFDESKKESFLDIGFYNFHKSAGNNIIYYSDKKQSDKFAFIYEFDGNFTELASIKDGTYEYNIKYLTAQYSESIGTFSVNQYEYSIGLIISNYKIRSANVDTTYINALDEDDVQYYVMENSVYNFYYGNGTYSEYEGTRF